MKLHGRNARRTAATAAVLLCIVLTLPAAAAAASNKGTAQGGGSLTAGRWAATAATTSMTFTASTNQASTITNTGTIALSAISYKVTISNPVSGSPTFKVYACGVAWVSNLCSGGAGTQAGGTLAKSSTTTVSSIVVPVVGGKVYLQVEPASVTSSVTVTLGTSITSPAQLRAAIRTNQ
jgi:hypothetical protein